MTTYRFSPSLRTIGGFIPFGRMEQYCLNKATDEELRSLIWGNLTPQWLIDEAQCELHNREEADYYG